MEKKICLPPIPIVDAKHDLDVGVNFSLVILILLKSRLRLHSGAFFDFIHAQSFES